jgi:hypothetical protein
MATDAVVYTLTVKHGGEGPRSFTLDGVQYDPVSLSYVANTLRDIADLLEEPSAVRKLH